MVSRKTTMFVGLDLSLTCTGFCAIYDRKLHIEAIKFDKHVGTRVDKCLKIAKRIKDLVTGNSVIFIEDYAYGVGKGANSLAQLGELNGIVKAVLSAYTGHAPYEISISTWKKFLCGKHNLNKDEFKMQVFKKFGVECQTNDEAAAVGLADFGYSLVNEEAFNHREFTKYEWEAITNFGKSKKKRKAKK